MQASGYKVALRCTMYCNKVSFLEKGKKDVWVKKLIESPKWINENCSLCLSTATLAKQSKDATLCVHIWYESCQFVIKINSSQNSIFYPDLVWIWKENKSTTQKPNCLNIDFS